MQKWLRAALKLATDRSKYDTCHYRLFTVPITKGFSNHPDIVEFCMQVFFIIGQANLCPKRSQEQESSIFLRINLLKTSRGKRWNRISETLNIKIFRGNMPPDPTILGWVAFGATTFLPTCVRKIYQKMNHYGSSKLERIMIESMITRKNRREPILILQSAKDMTNKVVKEIEKRDTLFGISFSFQQVQN